LENQILIMESYLITNCKKNVNDNIRNKVVLYSLYYTFDLVVVNNVLLDRKFLTINSL